MCILYAFRHSHGLERAHGPCFGSLLLPDQYHWCNIKVQTHSSISNLPSAMRPVPHSAELPVPKPPTNMTLSDSELSDKDVGNTNNNIDCDPTFAGACSTSERHLLTRGDLNDVCDLNLGIFYARRLSCVFPLYAMKNSRISSPRKMVSCFAMVFVQLWKFLAMNITQNGGACSLIRQK
jgi:hypothetical protein